MRIHFRLIQLLLALLMPSALWAAEVAVTLPPLAGLVKMIDPQVSVMCLLPNGADPHHFQMTPRKIEALANTGLLIRATRDDGGWPLPPKHGHSVDLWPETDHGWLSPQAVSAVLPGLAEVLTARHPERALAITEAMGKAQLEIEAVTKAWHAGVEPLRQGGVIMQHPAWRRLMQELGVPIRDVLESGHHGHEHGAHELEHALEHLQEYPGVWLLADAGHGNRALEWLHDQGAAHEDEHGHEQGAHDSGEPHMVTLNALGDCETAWVELMQANLARIQSQAAK